MTKDPGTSRIEAVSVDSGKRAVIAERATTPAWSPTGHILFARDEAVMAAPADAQTGAIRGPAVTVIPRGVIAAQGSGTMGFRFTSAGTLLYVPYEAFTRRVFSVSRDGAALDLGLPLGRYSAPRVSPDGRRLLLEDGRTVTQALDLARGTTQNIAPSALGTGFATWTTDGQRVVFRRFNLLTWIAADGSAREESPAGVITNDYPSGPGVDGDSILMVRVQPDTAGDVYLLSLSNRYPLGPLSTLRRMRVERSYRTMADGCSTSPTRRVPLESTSDDIRRSTELGQCRLAAAYNQDGTVIARSAIGLDRT